MDCQTCRISRVLWVVDLSFLFSVGARGNEVKCGICKHAEHEAGECARCNCGSSEVIRKTPMSGDFSVFDEYGRIHPSDGRRVYAAPNAA